MLHHVDAAIGSENNSTLSIQPLQKSRHHNIICSAYIPQLAYIPHNYGVVKTG